MDSHEVNYDESKVPAYELPSFLGEAKTAFDWVNFQRKNIIKLLADELYGAIPPRPDVLRFELISEKSNVLGGLGKRKLVRIHYGMRSGIDGYFDVLIYLPNNAKPAPAFVGLNFTGNHAATDETDVPMPDFAFPEGREPRERGCQKHRWQPEMLLKRGYAMVTACYHQIYCDKIDGGPESIYRLFPGDHGTYPAISAWAWGLSRMMDYVETDPELDTRHTAVVGHSRLGKTSLWAGANDTRFALVISNDSGCGGAALSRRCFGETLGAMVPIFPHWFNAKLEKHAYHSAEMCFDQHFLLALAAPRPLYVASAAEDLWADPKGERLGLEAAAPAYQLFGVQGLPDGVCAYHCRPGKHDINEIDWQHYLDFADHFFKRA